MLSEIIHYNHECYKQQFQITNSLNNLYMIKKYNKYEPNRLLCVNCEEYMGNNEMFFNKLFQIVKADQKIIAILLNEIESDKKL